MGLLCQRRKHIDAKVLLGSWAPQNTALALKTICRTYWQGLPHLQKISTCLQYTITWPAKTPKYRSLTGESQRRSFYPSKIAAVGFLNHLESDWISCLPLWSDKKSCKLLLPEIFGLNPLVPVPPVAAPQKHTFLRVPFGFQSTFSADSKLKIRSSLIETVRW